MKEIKEYSLGDQIPSNAKFLCAGDKAAKGGLNRTRQVFYYEIPVAAKKSAIKDDEAIEVIERVISYLNRKTGSKYTAKAKAHAQKIRARIGEGATPEQFKEAIDNQCEAWLDDPQMSPYLRPDTLFSSKFWGYLSNKSGAQKLNETFNELDNLLGESGDA